MRIQLMTWKLNEMDHTINCETNSTECLNTTITMEITESVIKRAFSHIHKKTLYEFYQSFKFSLVLQQQWARKEKMLLTHFCVYLKLWH